MMTTGPCVLGRAILAHEETFGNDTVSWPIHMPGYIHWKGENSQAIVATKCPGCGEGQDWQDGNNYMRLWKDQQYYCEDAASIFLADTDYSNIYTTDALKINPYLGWQPAVKPEDPSFSWRNCFNDQFRHDGCRENPKLFGKAPLTYDGWVPDVTMVRSMLMHGKDRDGNAFPPLLDAELCENINERGDEEDDANKECLSQALIKSGPLNSGTVIIDPSNHFGVVGKSESVTVRAPALMCLVYTISEAHIRRISAMRETWAGGCDGFLAFSTESDPRLPTISLPHDGPEEYINMWQKVRSIWKYVGAHYLDEFDWFLIGGDDLFVLPHNLKTYLASLAYKDGADPKSHEYFVGRRFKIGRKSLYFNSGGAGYVLSQATLRKFIDSIDDAEHCSAHKHTG